ncbi:MAG: MarR family transcriptional regulator, partial [Cytophagales bacterium]|nr:MarR family transcriptional regulator [Cytophagales bacterium]
TPEDSSGFLLWQVTNLWQRGIKKLLEKFDLTHPQFVLMASMFWFYEQKESVTQIRLSQHTKIDPMTTSTVLRTLQAKGFIRRQEHETDTRAKSVEITESGIKVVKLAVREVEAYDKAFFTPLGDLTKGFNHNLIVLLKSTIQQE